jgi:hypothetical protein
MAAFVHPAKAKLMCKSLQLPGSPVRDGESLTSEALMRMLKPALLEPIELLKTASGVGVEFLSDIAFFDGKAFYIFCVHGKKQVHQADRAELIRFLAEHIHPVRMEGIDIVVSDIEMRRFLVCNHDGDSFIIVR